MLLSNPIGSKIAGFYYDYTLYAAQAFKSLDQKTMRTSAKAMARYTGLTPSDRSSAGKTRPGSITREGSEHLRWAMTQAAMACLRCRSGAGLAVRDWIRAKERRMGCKGKARVAGARKLTESIWRLFHWGECFDVARPFGGVPALAN